MLFSVGSMCFIIDRKLFKKLSVLYFFMFDVVLNKNLVKYSKDFGFSKIYYVKDFKVIEGKNDRINRGAFENRNTDVVYSLEKFRIKDKLHYRDSGLNQVLAKLAKKNRIKVGINFNDILNIEGEKRAIILGRIMQNIRICNKYKVDMIIGSFAKDKYGLRNGKDLVAFGKLLGMKKVWNEIDNFFKDEGIGIKRIK
tara:strand:+ start:1238 stop:1828 length:591 start_codon:yes stop_codon:yes gene_type:complete